MYQLAYKNKETNSFPFNLFLKTRLNYTQLGLTKNYSRDKILLPVAGVTELEIFC